MIASDRAYAVTRASAHELEAAVAHLEDDSAARDPLWQRALRSSIESELYCRYRDLAEYEASHPELAADRLQDYGQDRGWDIIRARIAVGFRQVDLARMLGLTEEELRRLEVRRYAGANLDLVQRIAAAVGARIVIIPALAEPEAAAHVADAWEVPHP